MVQASSLKGRMRAASDPDHNPTSTLSKAEHRAIFGPETTNASEHAGAISFGDARLLLFPVRSLAGVFAWTTSVDALERFARAAQISKLELTWVTPTEKMQNDEAWIYGETLKAGGNVVLEEFSFKPNSARAADVQKIAQWLALNALPRTDEYKYWREQLPQKMCILPDDAFRDFVQYGTEVQTHIKIDPDKKTVAGGALWTSESLPMDTLLYAPVMATDARTKVNGNGMKADEVLKRVVDLNLERTQLGGDETTGQGFVALRWSDGGGQ